MRVDLRNDERDLGVHAPAGRVVDDGDTGRGKARSLRLGQGRSGREDGDVESRRVGGLRVLDDDVLSVERDDLAGTSSGGKETDLVDVELAVDEKLTNDGSDLTGRSDDTDARAHYRPVPA